MSQTNLSGVFHDIHDIRADELPAPKIDANSIILDTFNTGICGTDLHFYHEGLVPKGTVIGHEFSGRIVEVGSNVKDFKVGQRVGINPAEKGIGLGLVPGGFARQVKLENPVKDVDVFVLPDSISDKQGALLEPLSVGFAAVNLTDYSTSDNVLITGAGTIGLVTMSALLAKGVKNILMSDVSDFALDIAKRLGAKHVHNPKRDGKLTDFVTNLWGKLPAPRYGMELPNVQTAFECSGVIPVLKESMQCLAADGNLTMVAIYSSNIEIDPNVIVFGRLRVHGAVFLKPSDYQEAIDRTADGTLDLTPIVTHEFALSELPAAFDMAANGKDRVKVMVHPE